MLHLTRKEGESIIINNNIVIEIKSINKNSVKIGVSSPQNTSILRKEIYDKISEENIFAATATINNNEEEDN